MGAGMGQNVMRVRGAGEHNLKNIDVTIPRDQLVVITGLSGSGKSSLAFDTLYAEGQRRYVESLSAYARQFLGQMEKPDVDSIDGLSPAISIDQKTTSKNPRSTVGTITEIFDYLRVLYANLGIPHCPNDGNVIKAQSAERIVITIAGVAYGAHPTPDGYTLIFGHVGTFGFGPSLYQKLPYDPIKDFVPIILFAMVPNMLVVHPALPAKSVKELIALAKARPGQINYGSSGNGSASHLATEYFKLLSKINITAIPYKGTGPLVTDLIAGQTSLTITGVPPLYPFVQAGRLRALTVRSVKRLAINPDLPTGTESGVAGDEWKTWFGALAPAKTHSDAGVKLVAELVEILQRHEMSRHYAAVGN